METGTGTSRAEGQSGEDGGVGEGQLWVGAWPGPRACVLCTGQQRLTGIPVWPGRGRAQDEEDDGEDLGMESYDDDEDDEDQEAGVTAGRGTRASALSTSVGAAEGQARVGPPLACPPAGRAGDPDTQRTPSSPCDPPLPSRAGSLEKEPLLGGPAARR